MDNNKWLMIICCTISPIFSILGVTIFNVPVIFFIIIIFLGIGYILVCCGKLFLINQNKKKLSKKINKLSKIISRLKYEDASEDTINKKEKKYQKKKEDYAKLTKKFNKEIKNIKATAIILILFYVARSEPIVTFAKEVINVVIAPFVETTDTEEIVQPETTKPEEEIVQPETTKPEEEIVQPETTKPEEEIVQPETTKPEEEWIKIFLEYPDGYPGIDNSEYEELYNLLFYVEEEDLNDIIKNEIITWLNSCKNNTPLDVAVTAFGRSTEYYLNLESDFFNDKKVLSSNLLDEVIDWRKELFDLFPNGTVAWFLANYYQIYALNYLKQTNDERSILYFYMKSIQYAQKSLEFEMNNEIKCERIKYLQSRYKDIAECESMDENVRLDASKIYIEIQEVLNELQIS